MIEFQWVPIDRIAPNEWNPNRMDEEMFQKAVASIREFGFVDPVTVRHLGDLFEIIDGEHRWVAAKQEGLTEIPVIDVGVIEDDVAQQLTIVLNETRGQADPRKLGQLLFQLSQKIDRETLLDRLPYSRDAFNRLAGITELDLSSVKPATPVKDMTKWVERIYRMPKESAEVIDQALSTFKETEGESPDWKILEYLAADYLASS